MYNEWNTHNHQIMNCLCFLQRTSLRPSLTCLQSSAECTVSIKQVTKHQMKMWYIHPVTAILIFCDDPSLNKNVQ
jgi:hypothetical protein